MLNFGDCSGAAGNPIGAIDCTNLLPGGATGSFSPHTGIGIANFSIGTAVAGRLIVFAVATITDATNTTITNIDWGGNALTLIGTDWDGVSATGLRLSFYRLSIDTGTSATLTINYSRAVGGTAVTAWRLTGATSHVPFDFDVNTVLNTNTDSEDITVPLSGTIIAFGADVNTASDSDVLTGVTIQQTLSSLISFSYGFTSNDDRGVVTINNQGNGSATNTQRGIMAGSWL
jgi:hypothetical protein